MKCKVVNLNLNAIEPILRKYIWLSEANMQTVVAFAKNTWEQDPEQFSERCTLEIVGPAGTGKTHLQRVLRAVCNPEVTRFIFDATHPEHYFGPKVYSSRVIVSCQPTYETCANYTVVHMPMIDLDELKALGIPRILEI